MAEANCPCPTGDGGNRNIINQDEAKILAATIAAVGTRAGGTREDDSHVMGQYKVMASDVAGS